VQSQQFGNVFGRLRPGVTLAQAQAGDRCDRQSTGGEAHRDRPKSWSVSVEQLKNDWLDPKLVRNCGCCWRR